jgi:YD repeat-containing protein
MSRILAVIILFAASVSLAQGPDPADMERGIVPNRSYSGGMIDQINTANGSLSLMIPIYSVPQRGRLEFTFDLKYDSAIWNDDHECEPDPSNPDGGTQQYCYDRMEMILNPAPFVVWPDAYQTTVNVGYTTIYPGFGGYFQNTYQLLSLSDAAGTAHTMTYSYPDTTKLIALDNSGYTVQEFSDTHSRVTRPDGSYLDSSSGLQDLDGNTMTGSGNSLVYPGLLPTGGSDPNYPEIVDDTGTFVDTIGRTINQPSSVTSVNTSACPAIAATNQPLQSAYQWLLPGPNGGSLKYIFCYVAVGYRTSYFGPMFGSTTLMNQAEDETAYDIAGAFQAIQSITLPDGTYFGFVYDSTTYNTAAPDSTPTAYADLKRLIYPSGATVDYTWSDAYPGCGGWGVIPRKAARRVVTDVDGNASTWSYTYNVNIGAPGSGYTGTVITDPNGNDTVHGFTTFSDACHPTENLVNSYSGSYNASKIPMKSVQTIFQHGPVSLEVSLGVGVPVAVLPTQITTTIDGVSTTVESKEYQSFVTATGISCIEYNTFDTNCSDGEQIPVASGQVTRDKVADGSGNIARDVRYTYMQDDPSLGQQYRPHNLFGLPETATTYDGSSNQVALTTYGYDNSTYLDGFSDRRGHLTDVTKWNNTGSDIVTHQRWLPNGQLEDMIDGKGQRAAHFVYGSDGNSLHPTDSYDALNHHDQYTFDPITEALLSHTDPNQQTTNYTYDAAGRLWGVHEPDAGTTSTLMSTVYCYPSAVSIQTVQAQSTALTLPSTSNTCPSAGNSVSTTTMDNGIGQVIQRVLPTGSSVVSTYDGLGQLLSQTNPYQSVTDSTYGITSYTYDAIGRKLLQCQPDNGNGSGACTAGSSYLQWSHAGNQVTAYDELRNSSQYTNDVLGRLTNVVEPGNLQTNYSYDVLGNLTSVSQLGKSGDTAISRSFDYDSLSRLAWSSNPESGVTCYGNGDGTVGGCTPNYDNNGNLLSKTDARSVRTNYTYDALNRLTAKSYASDPSLSATTCFLYGTTAGVAGSNVVGRLTDEFTLSHTASTCPGSVPSSGVLTRKSVTAYDAMGRVKNSVQCVLANCTKGGMFALTHGYDYAGNLTSWTDGLDQSPFNLVYDAGGRLQTLTAASTFASYPPATLFSTPTGTTGTTGCGSPGVPAYTPSGALQNWSIGPINLVRTYDSRLRPTCENANVP